MKKLFFIVLIITLFNCCANFVLAQEKFSINLIKNNDYLILLNLPAVEILANDAKAIKHDILTTLYNEKNQILLKPLKDGIFRLYITLENEKYIVLEINTNSQNIENFKINKSKYIKTILKLDKIEQKKEQNYKLKLDEPPKLKPSLRNAY